MFTSVPRRCARKISVQDGLSNQLRKNNQPLTSKSTDLGRASTHASRHAPRGKRCGESSGKMTLKRGQVQPHNGGRYGSARTHMLVSTTMRQMKHRSVQPLKCSLDKYSVHRWRMWAELEVPPPEGRRYESERVGNSTSSGTAVGEEAEVRPEALIAPGGALNVMQLDFYSNIPFETIILRYLAWKATSDSDRKDVDTCARRIYPGKGEGIMGKPVLEASCWRSFDAHAEGNYGVSKCLDKRRLQHHTWGCATAWQVKKTTPTAPSEDMDSSSRNSLPYVGTCSTPSHPDPVHKQQPTA